MKAWTFVLFFVCFNISCNIMGYLMVLGVFVPLGAGQGAYGNSDISATFSLNYFSASNVALATLGGGIVGLVGLITRQGIFAIYAVLIFVLGIFLGIGQWMFYGVYSLTNSLLLGTGLEVFLPALLQVLTTVFFFFFLASILSQRQDLT